jgi:hypothetical protein
MPKKHYLTIAAAAMLGLSSLSTAFAGTETAAPGKETKQVTPPCPVTYITGDFGVTFTSEYITRGLVAQDKGVIAQPYLDLYIKLYSGDANSWFINSVSAQLSFWSDVGSNTYTANTAIGLPQGYYRSHHNLDAVPNWYEFDWDPGISITFAQKFTLLVQYFEFDSPAGAFSIARSINSTLTYDDTSLWANTPLGAGNFSFKPHFTYLWELPAAGFAGLGPQGSYFEIGVAPSYTFMPKATYPITLSIPYTVGLGNERFYGGDNFGYFSVGPTVSVPLAFIPSGFGSWTLSASYLYYYEGKSVRAFNIANGTDGSNSRNVFSGAIGCTF